MVGLLDFPAKVFELAVKGVLQVVAVHDAPAWMGGRMEEKMAMARERKGIKSAAARLPVELRMQAKQFPLYLLNGESEKREENGFNKEAADAEEREGSRDETSAPRTEKRLMTSPPKSVTSFTNTLYLSMHFIIQKKVFCCEYNTRL